MNQFDSSDARLFGDQDRVVTWFERSPPLSAVANFVLAPAQHLQASWRSASSALAAFCFHPSGFALAQATWALLWLFFLEDHMLGR